MTLIGGLVGEIARVDIDDCYSTGNITHIGQNNNFYAGGLIGEAVSSNILQAYSTGDISASTESDSSFIGGLIAYFGVYVDDNKIYKFFNSFASGDIDVSSSKHVCIGDLYYGYKDNKVEFRDNYTFNGQEITASTKSYNRNKEGATGAQMEEIWQFVYYNWNASIWEISLSENPTLKR